MAVRRFDLPDLGEGLEEAEIVEWHVAPGERVVADQPLVSVETDKAVVEIPAPWSGVVEALLAGPGEILRVGAPLVSFETAGRPDPGAVVGRIDPEAPTPPSTAAPEGAPKAPQATAATAPGGPVRAIPAARALATRHGISLDAIAGTGPGGAITLSDVEALLAAAPDTEGWEELRGARRAMARRMAAAAEVVRATLHDVAEVTAWMTPGADILARLVRATVRGVAAAPVLNAWFDAGGPSIRQNVRIDIGLAVDTPEGLYVPVLRDAAALGGAEMRAEAERMIANARAHALGLADLAEPTITLSNFGPIGGRHAELVISPPQVAILGAGRVYPVYRETGVCLLLPMSLSFDHRAATGGDAARFMAAVVADLERPD